MSAFTPKQVVAELDKYIIAQGEAKRAVAVALRNRYRRAQLPNEVKDEITPKNIIMKGPTGVGKTEKARRLAKLVKAPFVKVEATKYTEVGYVGRDVESMIRDLVEVSVRLVKEERVKDVSTRAGGAAERRIVDSLFPMRKAQKADVADAVLKEELLSEIRAGKLDKTTIEIDVAVTAKPVEIMPGTGMEMDLGSMLGGMFPQRKKKRKLTVKEAMQILTQEEAEKLIDNDSINAEAIRRAEDDGIIFIDEIDKIASRGHGGSGPDVSREGVQRDILPIVEGCTVNTKYGSIRTDYILFIASGAFHISKIEDLIPELQGRFPIKVELKSLSEQNFIDILTIPENSVTRQYSKLLKVDNVSVKFTKDAIATVARIAAEVNSTAEDIGARRLHTIMEYLLEDISFNADGSNAEPIEITIDKPYVEKHLQDLIKSQNLKKYIL